jgi:DNA-binding MarR family transcriptional regulator
MQRDDHLINLVGAFVSVAGDDLRRVLEDEAEAGGSQPAALFALDTWPDRSVDFLARVLGLTHPGAVRLVDRLVEAGLVSRRSGVDGRTAALRLTARGRARSARARASRRQVLADLLTELTTAERRALDGMLDRVLRRRSRSRIEAHHDCRLCDHSVCRGDDCPIGMSVEGE